MSRFSNNQLKGQSSPRKESNMLRNYLRSPNATEDSLLVLLICFVRGSYSQTFSSGSTGIDGALNLTTPGTILFNPKTFNPPLDQDGDNIYNFTTINIGAGVTVKLTNA